VDRLTCSPLKKWLADCPAGETACPTLLTAQGLENRGGAGGFACRAVWPAVLGEAADGVGFVLMNVENRVKLGDLQQIFHTMSQTKELQVAALVGDGRESGHQLADAGAIDVGYFLEVQKDILMVLLNQVAKGIPQGARPFAQGDPARHVDYGNIPYLPGY